jgi:hypothetical protein
MIGADGVERSVRNRLPERLDVFSGAQRGDGEETVRIGSEINIRIEEEMVRAGLRETVWPRRRAARTRSSEPAVDR